MSAGQRSDIQINPDTPEAQALKQWYDFEGYTASTQHAGEGLVTARYPLVTPVCQQSRANCLAMACSFSITSR